MNRGKDVIRNEGSKIVLLFGGCKRDMEEEKE